MLEVNISLHAKGCSSLYHPLCLLGIASAGLDTLCIATHSPSSFVGCGTTRSIHIAYFVHVRGGEVVGGDVVEGGATIICRWQGW